MILNLLNQRESINMNILSLKKNYILVFVSIILGFFNIALTLFVSIAITQVTGRITNPNVILIINMLNICGNIETYTKSVGLLLGLFNVFSNSKKLLSVIGLVLNFLSIIWTLMILGINN